jgi:hypothetical protein
MTNFIRPTLDQGELHCRVQLVDRLVSALMEAVPHSELALRGAVRTSVRTSIASALFSSGFTKPLTQQQRKQLNKGLNLRHELLAAVSKVTTDKLPLGLAEHQQWLVEQLPEL